MYVQFYSNKADSVNRFTSIWETKQKQKQKKTKKTNKSHEKELGVFKLYHEVDVLEWNIKFNFHMDRFFSNQMHL